MNKSLTPDNLRQWAYLHSEGAQMCKQAVAKGKNPEQMALLGLIQTVASQVLSAQAAILEEIRGKGKA